MRTKESDKRTELARPLYITRNEDGIDQGVFCKVCGTQISGWKLLGATPQLQFVRFRNYAEIKIQFADGSHHVTNLCKSCIPVVQKDRGLLVKMLRADIDDMLWEEPDLETQANRLNPRIVAIDTNRRGIK